MKSLDHKDRAHMENLRYGDNTDESNHLKGYQECHQGFEGCLQLNCGQRDIFLRTFFMILEHQYSKDDHFFYNHP